MNFSTGGSKMRYFGDKTRKSMVRRRIHYQLSKQLLLCRLGRLIDAPSRGPAGTFFDRHFEQIAQDGVRAHYRLRVRHSYEI